MMLNIKPKYVVDAKGRKTAVVLSIKDFRALMQRLFEHILKYDQNYR